ncbi:hypothetical protein [Flavobacterium sp. WC2430]|uniref:hypothetical protein n=1 Tax=Flavobacterium sp. WC2430 TaxID=3234137 RepID=UPI0034678F72
MTQKEALLYYLQRMDIDMLDTILSDNITYYGVPKSVFLERLNYIFNNYNLGIEIEFLKLKQKDKTSNIYYLSFDKFEFEPEFIIEEKEGTILNISNSVEVNSQEDVWDLHPWELFFGEDEKANFNPTNDYVITLHKCTIAFEKFINNEIQILTSDIIFNWLKMYESVYNGIENDYLMFKYNDFKELYSTFQFYTDTLKYYKNAKIAVSTFENFDIAEIQKWIDQYSKLFFCETQSLTGCFKEINYTDKTAKLIGKFPNIYFKGDDFISIIKFNELYLKHCESNPEMDGFQMGHAYFLNISED